ncbi:hypothetical protein HNR02_001823 [Amycolatopsis endophytica]|uniref:Transposase n=1 Tax=Amycolatopsis endophytica TaxID=860233 RepID=A0A853B0H7_9PSEU|nr:hypothetical protein [Amycolatopsis endophytica]
MSAHYSGSFWAATENDLVIYESRLELARLLFADFDASVRHIVAQPFLLRAEVDGDLRRHIPDYLLFTDAGPVVVDVKPRHRVARPENAFTFAWTQRTVESRGWRYEVSSEPHPKPFVWTKTADDILDTLAAYCSRINDSRH